MIPKLRLREFYNAAGYTVYDFSDLFEFSSGKNIKQNEASKEFKTPCVRYGELYHMYSEVIDDVINRTNLESVELRFSLGDEILLPSAGEDPLGIGSASALTLPNIAIGRTINVLRPKQENTYSHIYVAYYINEKLKKKIASLAKGVSISNVYNSDLRTLQAVLPSVAEQNKVASFMRKIDTKINLLTKKKEALETYKKGLMQKIFSQELRFKRENGTDYPEWERKELIDIMDYEQPTKYIVDSTEYSDHFKTPVLTAGKTFILGFTDEDKNHFTDFPVIIFDDFTTAFKFVDFAFKVKSSAMKILRPRENVNVRFVYEAMKIIRFPKGEHKRYWISEYCFMKIPFPSEKEQHRIAALSIKFDQKTDAVDRELETIQKLKKGLLQQMFV